MSKLSTVALYKSQIAEAKENMQNMQARFETEEYKNCNKYPSFMHEELHEKYMNQYANSIKQLEKLILELV